MVVTPSERDILGHDLRVKGKMVNPQPAPSGNDRSLTPYIAER